MARIHKAVFPPPRPGEERIFEKHRAWAIRRILSMCVNMPPQIDLSDVIQEGLIGLLEAIRKHDPMRGDLRPYALSIIEGRVLEYRREQTAGPRRWGLFLKRRDELIAEFMALHSRMPERSEIAAIMGYDLKRYTRYENLSFEVLRMTRLRLAKSKLLYPDWNVWDQDRKRAVLKALPKLTKREAQVLYLLYVKNLKAKEVATVLSMTEGRVSQLRSGALARIRRELDQVGYHITP